MSKCMWSADHFVKQHFIQFGIKLYRKVAGIPMGTNWAPLVADLFLFDLILYVPSTIFQLNRDGSSWVEQY